ncbi:MAG: response regulator [Thermomicrobiales bacterium]
MACIHTTTAATVRILLVDDADSVRRALRHILTSEPDFAVIGEAADGVQAVALAAALRPDIIVLDLALPGISGIEAARRIHAAGDAATIVMLTAFSSTAMRAAASDAGIALFLEKSDDLDDLVERIRLLHNETMRPDTLSEKNGGLLHGVGMC